MTRREKSMFIMILVMVAVFGHFWVAKKYIAASDKKDSQISKLESKASLYRSSASTSELIMDEVEWLKQYEPKPSTYGETQSELVKFLNDAGKQLGFTPVKPRLIQLEDDGGKYRRVKVQITATATEEMIYQWLVNIHQPTKFRAVTLINLKPTPKDDEKITCTLTAEQWLVDAEQMTGEEVEG